MNTPPTNSLCAKSQRCGSSKSRNWTAAAAACLAGLTIVPCAEADIAGFTQVGAGPTDYTINASPTTPTGVPNITGGILNLTTAANDEATSAWFNTPQSVSNFTASFTYDFLGGTTNPADGFAFVLQNSGLSALGGGGGALGYVGINNSVALGFDLWNNNTAGTVTNSTFSASGYLGFNNYQNTAPVSLRDTVNTVDITVAFRDGVFTETLTQGANIYTRSAFYNVSDRVGSTGFIGFTGGTGGANAGQSISNFTFTTGNAPAVPPAPTALTGVPQGGPGVWGIREVIGANGCCGDLTQAQAAILGNTGILTEYTAPVVNLYDSGGRGRFRFDSLYRSDPDQVTPANDTVNNIAVLATATVRIPTTGVYTFGVNSDDGFRLTIDGKRFEAFYGQGGTSIDGNGSLQFTAGRGVNDSLGAIFLTAGDHQIQMLNWEGGGGAAVEIYASAGAKTAFDYGTFSLLGSSGIPAHSGQNRVVNVAQWSLKEYTGVNNVTEVLNNGRNGTGTQRGTTSTVFTINFNDPDNANNGSHGADAVPFPNDTPGFNDDAYGAFATTTLTIADAGIYTFMMFTDDDSRFRIMSGTTPLPLLGNIVGDGFDSDGNGVDDQFGTGGCCFDQLGHYDLAAGTYNIEAAFHEGGGGSGFFIYATKGERDTFDPAAFQLLGANVDGAAWNTDAVAGLQLVPEPGSISMLGLAAVGLLARRRRR
jgi:Bacterial lectin/PA14 domain/PEP-CTERM motif